MQRRGNSAATRSTKKNDDEESHPILPITKKNLAPPVAATILTKDQVEKLSKHAKSKNLSHDQISQLLTTIKDSSDSKLA